MEITTDIVALRKAVEDAPEDWDLKLVLADALEERGLQLEADCWRWMGTNHKRPKRFLNSVNWYDIDRYSRIADIDPESNVSSVLFSGLKNFDEAESTKGMKEFRSLEIAIGEIVNAWKLAVGKGWKP